MQRKKFTDLTFKEIVNSILNESTEEIDDFAPQTEEETTDESDDTFDVSDFEEEDGETETTDGDVTLTLTLDEVSVLRSIMAKIDAMNEEEDTEEEPIEDEDDDVEITEEEDTEDSEDDADIPVPEEEETIVTDGRGDTAVTVSNKGVSRKKGAPAIDRTPSRKSGLMGNPAAAGDADTVEFSNVGVNRKKGAPAISRSGKHTGTRIAPGKATIEIGK